MPSFPPPGLLSRFKRLNVAVALLSVLALVTSYYMIHYRSVIKSTARTALVLDSRFNSLATQVTADGLHARAATQGLAAMDRKIEALSLRIENSDSNRMRALEEKLASIQASVRHMSGVYVPLLLVGDGNSLMFGSGGAVPFLQQTSDMLGLPLINKGVRGQNIQDMIADAARDVDPLLEAEGVRPVLIVWEGLNYMRDTRGKSAADYVDLLEAYCRARRAAGWQRIVVVNSASHNWPSGSWKPGKTAGEINEEIKQRWRGFADAMLDVSWLMDPSALDLYQSDQIHLTTRAQAHIARDLIGILPDLQSNPVSVEVSAP